MTEKTEELEKLKQEVDNAAFDLLKDPNILGRIEKILSDDMRYLLDRDLGIVREKRTKLYVFLMFLSGIPVTKVVRGGKKGEPEILNVKRMPQMLQVRGSSRSGKTRMCHTMTYFFKVKTIGDWSQKALNYMDLKGHDVLYFQEFKEADQEGSSIRLIAAEDGGFTVSTVEANPDGGFQAVERKIDPIAFITTTTREIIEEQMTNRSHVLNTDESEAQTRAILQYLEDKEMLKLPRMLGKVKTSQNPEILKKAIYKLDKYADVVVTCPQIIKKLLPSFLNIRMRSDYTKIISLIKLITFLHQYQRPYVEINKQKVIFAMPQDIYLTLELIRDSLLTMALNLEARQRELIPYLQELRKLKHKSQQGIDEEGFTRNDVKAILANDKKIMSIKTIERRLNSLVDAGIIDQSKSGRDVVYRVIIDDDDINAMLRVGKTFEISDEILEDAKKQSREYFEKKLKTWIPEAKMPDAAAFEIYPQPQWFDNDYELVEQYRWDTTKPYDKLQANFKHELLAKGGKQAFMKFQQYKLKESLASPRDR